MKIKDQLLPEQWITNSIETYIYQYTSKSQIIYIVTLLAVISAIVSLPFIYIDVSVRGNGIVRPIAEKTEIVSPITEIVDTVYVHEGDKVKKGDLLFCFRTNTSDYKIKYQSERLSDFEAHISDLRYLAKGEHPSIFLSPTRRQEYTNFLIKKKELETNSAQYRTEWLRNKTLYDEKLICEEEYNKYLFQYQNKQNELKTFIENQISTWQTDKNSYENQYKEMHTNMKETRKDKDMYIVRSPINGTIDQFSGIYKGSSLQAGQNVAVISPDSVLYLEVYVTPRDIGYIFKNMPIKVQIESFNYNEWGTIKGKVDDVSSDYLTDNKGNSFYKVKCKLQERYLTLKKTGRRGYLKKGMTASAHFVISRRSLFSLLYQNIDEWINPSQYKNSVAKTPK